MTQFQHVGDVPHSRLWGNPCVRGGRVVSHARLEGAYGGLSHTLTHRHALKATNPQPRITAVVMCYGFDTAVLTVIQRAMDRTGGQLAFS
jgi:hypothetical protein